MKMIFLFFKFEFQICACKCAGFLVCLFVGEGGLCVSYLCVLCDSFLSKERRARMTNLWENKNLEI